MKEDVKTLHIGKRAEDRNQLSCIGMLNPRTLYPARLPPPLVPPHMCRHSCIARAALALKPLCRNMSDAFSDADGGTAALLDH